VAELGGECDCTDTTVESNRYIGGLKGCTCVRES
jgi:hypothetical protein